MCNCGSSAPASINTQPISREAVFPKPMSQSLGLPNIQTTSHHKNSQKGSSLIPTPFSPPKFK